MNPCNPPAHFTFPELVPAKVRYPPPPDFKLLPEAPVLHSLPETPPIPPIVASGDLITAAHENMVTEALSDLWTDVQALDSGAPEYRRE
jgi:hypothetical protein